MRQVQFLACKMYSYDTDSFINDALNYSRDSIIFVFDFEKFKCFHRPSDISLAQEEVRLLHFSDPTLNRCLAPFCFMINIFLIFFLFSRLIMKYRPSVCWMENTYAAFATGIFRRLRYCSKSFYLPGDWPMTSRYSNFWSFLANGVLFPFLDYWACRFNDVVLNHTQEIAQARYRLWNKKIAAKEALYDYKLKIKIPEGTLKKDGRAICFLGSPRKDSGLDLAILALPELRKHHDFTLKIVGPKRQGYDFFKNLSVREGVESYVQLLGFVETQNLPEVFSDCFCGLNLITDRNSYTSFTIPGKLIHYFQHLLPVIVTDGIGPMVQILKVHQLGLVIEPNIESFVKASLEIYKKREVFRENIKKYIATQPHVDIKNLIEG